MPPGQRPQKIWPFNFDDQDRLLLDRDPLLLYSVGGIMCSTSFDHFFDWFLSGF